MLVLSSSVIPDIYKTVKVHGFVEYTHRIEISNKGLIRNISERNRNEHQEAYEGFINSASAEGNVIYGVGISTSTAQFKEATYMYMTYYGTLATIENK
ncbi:hypothetical protein ABEG75_19395 [Pantoea agglomerans]|uniref:hypothetical protein n=1 Tax=Pantoea TaxID=53335 RepID=UPI0005343F72|nr:MULTISPECIES: hypothetical protein [Pantoea]PVY82139.1 hypothetical protein C7427_11240 [Pantoea ananatis]WRO92300.1 hypothetical protein U9K49_19715 [Pantoea agglomerans]